MHPGHWEADKCLSVYLPPLLYYKQFHATLSKIGNSFCLLTAGPLPLRNLLHPEMYRTGIPLQKYLCRYFDIFTEFSKVLPNVQPVSTTEEICDGILHITYSAE